LTIQRIRIANFKTFNDVEISLSNFNVIIGANASGKSNFIEIFKFIQDFNKYGLQDAISAQGGITYFRNLQLAQSKNFILEFDVIPIDEDDATIFLFSFNLPQEDKRRALRYEKLTYKLEIEFNVSARGIKKVQEELILKCDLIEFKKIDSKTKRIPLYGKPVTIDNGKIKFIIDGINFDFESEFKKGTNISSDEIVFPQWVARFEKLKKKEKISCWLSRISPFLPLENILNDISIFDFDPRLIKQPAKMTGKKSLNEDGSNLAVVLKGVLSIQDKRRKFLNLIKDALPFIKELDTEESADRSLIFHVREKYYGKKKFYSPFMSDGTVNVTALILALYFDEQPLSIIEEPERNIHPFLLSRVIEMMKDASKNKQIIATTHNPEIVKYTGIENLFILSRDEEGFSNIIRPETNKRISAFLKKDMGVEELFIRKMLEN